MRYLLEKGNAYTLVLAILGAGKLILQGFGVEIPDQTINDIANGVSAVLTLVGIIMNHFEDKRTKELLEHYEQDPN